MTTQSRFIGDLENSNNRGNFSEMLTWLKRGTLLSFGLCSSGCALGSSPLLHHPNPAGNLDGYVGYSLPVQPATARVIATPPASASAAPVTRELSANTGLVRPAVGPGYVAYLFDPKIYGSVGVTDHLTLVGEAGWHRVGLSMDYFTRATGRGGFKFAGGGTGGPFVHEIYGWVEGGYLPVLSEEWSGYVGVGASFGRFRHFFRLPDYLYDTVESGDGVIPTTDSFADLLRKEFRLRLPIGATVRPNPKTPSVSFGVIPYATVAHGEPRVVNCRDCEATVTFEELKQNFGVELQGGVRF